MISGGTGKGQNGAPVLTVKSVIDASVVSCDAPSAAAGAVNWMLCSEAPSQRWLSSFLQRSGRCPLPAPGSVQQLAQRVHHRLKRLSWLETERMGKLAALAALAAAARVLPIRVAS
jgi:hypothetical protein